MTPTDVLAAAIARRINTHKHRCPEAANTEPEPWMTAAANDIVDAMLSIGWRVGWSDDDPKDEIAIVLNELAPELDRRTELEQEAP